MFGKKRPKITLRLVRIMLSRGRPDDEDWELLRKYILKRDNYQCQEPTLKIFGVVLRRCGNRNRILHVHHKKPLSEGGSNLPWNLTTLDVKHHKSHHPHMR